MSCTSFPRRAVAVVSALFLVLPISIAAVAQQPTGQPPRARVKLERADQLPPHSYKVRTTALSLFQSDTEFAELAQRLAADLRSDMATYDIQDRATLKSYYGTLGSLALERRDYNGSRLAGQHPCDRGQARRAAFDRPRRARHGRVRMVPPRCVRRRRRSWWLEARPARSSPSPPQWWWSASPPHPGPGSQQRGWQRRGAAQAGAPDSRHRSHRAARRDGGGVGHPVRRRRGTGTRTTSSANSCPRRGTSPT